MGLNHVHNYSGCVRGLYHALVELWVEACVVGHENSGDQSYIQFYIKFNATTISKMVNRHIKGRVRVSFGLSLNHWRTGLGLTAQT